MKQISQSDLDAITQTFESTNLCDKAFDLKSLFLGLDPESDLRPLRKWANKRGVDIKDFDSAAHYWRVVATLGDYPQNCGHLMDLFAKTYSLTVDYSGVMLATGLGEEEPNASSVETELRSLVHRLALPPKRFTKGDISDAFTRWCSSKRNARLAGLTALITQPLAGKADWQALALAISDPTHSPEYVIAALQTTMWCVKRKLINDPAYQPENHLMVVLTGTQGGGKTQIAKRFFSPIAELVYEGDFHQITDKSNLDIWNYPVVFCDEMEKAEKADIEAVKNAITSERRRARLLHTNITSFTRNKTTLFGGANGTLGEKILDTTGMRRFAAVRVKSKPSPENIAAGIPVVDWGTVNAVDYLALWHSVDHRQPSPLLSCDIARAEWLAINESERAQDSVEIWLRQFSGNRFDKGKTRFTGGELYPLYAEFCRENGYKACASNNLGKRMKGFAEGRAPWLPFHQPTTAKGLTRWELKDLPEADSFQLPLTLRELIS
ncbi:MAG: hypothetical protein GW858_00300 [Sphingomonadales bacterium]|nr:hypothetical protein [Sphingomonadales bacterium]NCQ22756.1 hypothetical protein [Sphingomonadales bacterium]NCT05030.1 hypothetical protein [Sphingomonadales bacterium]